MKADHDGVVDSTLSTEDLLCICKIEDVIHYDIHLKEILLENRLSIIE